MIDARIIDLDGQAHSFSVDKVSFVNQDSYGPGKGFSGIESGTDTSVLIINVNGIAAAKFDTD